MRKRIFAFFVAVILVVSAAFPAYAAEDDSDSTIIEAIYSAFEPVYGEIYLRLRTGFDFLEVGSVIYDPNLALIGLALSQQVYDGKAQALLKKLGYEETRIYPESGESSIRHPLSCFGYRRYTDSYGNEMNVFAIIVRGTASDNDLITDLTNGVFGNFDNSTDHVREDFIKFATSITGKSFEELKQEDNRFFIAGHSLGGAVANKLSADSYIKALAGENKNKIFAYTYESPNTCERILWYNPKEESYAFNFKNVYDKITDMPPFWGSTRHGTDLEFSAYDSWNRWQTLDNSIFEEVFPNANGGDVVHATSAFYYKSSGDLKDKLTGDHDMGLDLTYIIQKGIDDGYWDSVDEVVVPKSDIMQTRTMLNIETGEFEEVTYDASKVMQWDDFVAAYPDVVCILELSGEEFEEYTESMWICEFQLRDSDGNLLERAGAFNITGYDGTDPVGWGETYGPITYQSSDGYDSYTYYIRYQDTIVMGPASIEINTYTAPTPDEDNVLFNTIAGKTFSFSSGMGGWATTMVINADGTFTGEYYDEEYDAFEENSIILYQCSFSGKFSTPGKVSDCEYVMYLESLETEQEPGTEYSEYDDAGYKITHKYTDPYGLDGAREIRVYLPEAPTSELPEKFLGWLSMRGDAGTELGCYGLYNVNSGQSFFAE